MTIGRATAADFDWVSSQLNNFVDSLGYRNKYLPESGKLLNLLSNFSKFGVFLIARDESGNPIGTIAGELFKHPYNDDVNVLYEHFWWVPPEHRHTGAGGALLRAFIEEGKRAEAVVRVSLEHNTELPPGYLERFGLRLAEKTYILE